MRIFKSSRNLKKKSLITLFLLLTFLGFTLPFKAYGACDGTSASIQFLDGRVETLAEEGKGGGPACSYYGYNKPWGRTLD